MRIFHWIVGYICHLVLNIVNSMPIDDQALNYLENFGYLPQSSGLIHNLIASDGVESAIKQLQKIGNIPETGEIDRQTLELLQKPRCGNSDTNLLDTQHRRSKRFLISGKWGKTQLTWNFINSNNRWNDRDKGQIRRLLYDAFAVWQKNSLLTFREANDPEADIIIDFASKEHGDGYKFDGISGILAHAFPPSTWHYGGDVHFDDDEEWHFEDDDSKHRGTSFFAVALHELGHSIGLGHSSVQGSIMFPWYSSHSRHSFEIPEDDKLGIQEIYGRVSKWGPNSVNPRPSTRTTESTARQTRPQPRPRPESPQHPSYRPDNPQYPAQRPERPQYPAQRPESPQYSPQRPQGPQDPAQRPQDPQYPSPTLPPTEIEPDTCNTSYDAIATIRNEVFVFKGKFMWRIKNGTVMAGYPSKIKYLWRGLPESLTRVDAAFENDSQRKIWFFLGKKLYVYESSTLVTVSALTDLGLPAYVKKVDAIFTWGHNKRTFIFAGDEYWRMDEQLRIVEKDYPRNIAAIWKNVNEIDTGFQKDGKTYFFKGKAFYQFDDGKMRIDLKKPQLSSQHWMQCPPNDEDIRTIQVLARTSDASAVTMNISLVTIAIILSKITLF